MQTQNKMVSNLDHRLEDLRQRLVRMGELCCSVIEAAVQVLQTERSAGEVFELDAQIDAMALEVQNFCMQLMLMGHPVAGDLRSITAAMHMAQDMERIGDQAADLTQLARYVDVHAFTGTTHILTMANETMDMVRMAISAYLYSDVYRAQWVIQKDDIVDQLFVYIRQELVTLIAEDAQKAIQCMDFVMIAKYFERIGDHAQNIADWAMYAVNGELPQRDDVRGGE